MSWRANTRLTRKGALVAETHEVLRLWEPEVGWAQHLAALQSGGGFSAGTEKWRHEIIQTLRVRFSDPESLVLQALARIERKPEQSDSWIRLLHFQLGTTDLLYWRFSTEWLWNRFLSRAPSISPAEVAPWIRDELQKDLSHGNGLSEYGQARLARDLVRMATDVRVLVPTGLRREIARPSLPSELLLFLLQLLSEQHRHPQEILESPLWRLFFWSKEDLVHELVELDQYGRLGYQAAGSIVDLRLPAPSARAYLEEWLPR